ncbi:protein translocase subunit SecF [Mariniluteicoccus flavus]
MSSTKTTGATKTPGSAGSRPSSTKKDSLTHRLYTGQIAYDFVNRRKRWYAISAALLALSLLSLLVRGLDLGIEFKGGADFQAPTQVNSQTVDEMRSAVEKAGVPNLHEAAVTTIGDRTVRVQTRTLNAETEVPKLRQAIAEQVNTTPDKVAYNLIGASWGQQITQQAGIALVVFLGLVMIMIWAYFRDLKMSIAAIVALLHDLIITVGIYALVGFTVTPATLIGMLTILGYSLYDTVVVFDKVRENVKDLTKTRRTYSEAANDAVNQVLVRSLNTTIIGVLPVAALLVAGWFILGTGPLKDLGLALFVGMIAGAYSSVFIATPLLVDMKEREPAMREHRERIQRRQTRRRRTGDATTEDVSEPTNEELAAADDEARGGDAEETTRSRTVVTTARVTPTRTVATTDDDTPRTQPRNQTRSQRRK